MKAELGGSFLDRLTQELRDAWGMKVNGSFTADAGIVFNAGVFAAPHEEADYQEGVYSFYYCERSSRGAALFQTTNQDVFDHCVLQYYGNPLRSRYAFPELTLGNTASIRSGWTMVRTGSSLRHDYLGIRSDDGKFYPCKTGDFRLLAGLSHVVEYSPLEVLECYLRPDAAPLLTQWLSKSAG